MFENCKRGHKPLFFVFPQITINLIKDDPDDNAILECAFTAEVEYIVTGDSHLLTLESFKGIKILSPSEFLSGTVIKNLEGA